MKNFLALCTAALAAITGTVCAQPFPSRPITIVVPYTPGAGGDLIARKLAPEMARSLGQPVVVENRVGASGTIGTAGVAKAPADGHTLLSTADTITMLPYLYKHVTFSPSKDFAPIAMVANGTWALAVTPSLPANSLADLVELAKTRPGGLSYASPGLGTPHYFLMELFKQTAKIDMLHVPYKGMSGLVTDLIGGQVQVALLSLNVALPHVTAGKLRLVAVIADRRSPLAPSIPTLQEVGYANFPFAPWIGLLAPAGTPRPVVERLHRAIGQALASSDVRDALRQQGLEVALGSPDELGTRIRADMERWKTLVERSGVEPE
ncbi:tripartite tricarboxylate transporter substrate binding protein [Pigmentiphaga sp. NML080357]|uniref:Bug family tripartite tricarboxylate transporter substrate binding protein n=1 Tax=Pigmentiphaga sp. NML080357 TaxID=2008675 RepID=UPI001303464E|nr:tripartite tricarboxylate transporter substrate binding protein [Pigmentiphaga sp. NML080357]